MTGFRPMTDRDALSLQELMAAESNEYLANFTAFKKPDELRRQREVAELDCFTSIVSNSEVIGFFCLRGLDEGYEKPAFGVYVASFAHGQGHARNALLSAEEWCRARNIQTVMLKVSATNLRAHELYDSSGFKAVGRCPDNGHMIMEKRLD